MIMKAKELAQKLNVSPATISLVLNNKPGISDHLRHSLIQQIKDLGCEEMLCNYTPVYSHAPTSRQGIAYLIYTDSEESSDKFAFYPEVLEGAEIEARENEYNFLVFHVTPGTGNITQLISNANVIGAVVQAKHISHEILEHLSSLDIPYVFIDAYRPDIAASCVCVNNEQGIYSAVRYLKELGHENLGYISTGYESDTAVERRRNFHLALREYGLEDNRRNYYSAISNPGESLSSALCRKFTESPPEVTAFLAENDVVAWQTIEALKHCGYKIPEDISIIGFDDRSVCTLTLPNLTTVKNFRNLMGRQAISMVKNKLRMKKLYMEDSPIKYELPTKLIIRDSVRDLRDAEA